MSHTELDRLRYRARTLQRRATKAGRSSGYWKEAEKAVREYHQAKEQLRKQHDSNRDK